MANVHRENYCPASGRMLPEEQSKQTDTAVHSSVPRSAQSDAEALPSIMRHVHLTDQTVCTKSNHLDAALLSAGHTKADLSTSLPKDKSTKYYRDVSCTYKINLAIMPVVFQQGSFMVLDHGMYCLQAAEQPEKLCNTFHRCPFGVSRSVFDAEAQRCVMHTFSTPSLHGLMQPDFNRSFHVHFRGQGKGCCLPTLGEQSPEHSCDITENPDKSPKCFSYTKESCGKFRQYRGVPVSVTKYKGDVLILAGEKLVASSERICTEVSSCIGIQCLDVLFEPTKATSSHVVHLLYCPYDQVNSDGKYLIPVKGSFVVYMYVSPSPTAHLVPDSQLAGTLPLESMASMDNMISDLGGPCTKLIIQSYINNTEATSMWNLGCGIILMNVANWNRSVVMHKQEDRIPH